MIKPIKFIPGDIVLLYNKKYIVTRIFENLLYFANIKSGIEDFIFFSDLNINMLTRIDYIGPNFNDDFLCHNCFPSKLAGCVDCHYRSLIKSRKQFFCPGDKVRRPYVRETFTIKSVELAIIDDNDNKTTVRNYDSNKLKELYEKIDSNNITEEDRKSLCHLFSINEPSLHPFYAYNKLRLIKRTSYRLDKTQLDYICNDICIYGEGSKECESCETGILKRNLKKRNDI